MPWPKCSTLNGQSQSFITMIGVQARLVETGVTSIQHLQEFLESIFKIKFLLY